MLKKVASLWLLRYEGRPQGGNAVLKHLVDAAEIRPKDVKLLNIKVTKEERRAIKDLALKYTDGDVSAWLRYAGMNCVPKKQDLSTP